MLPKKAVRLLLIAVTIVTAQSNDTSSSFQSNKNRFLWQNRRSVDSSVASTTLRHDPTFDPDVLNRFLEEYAIKMRRTTQRPNVMPNKFKFDHQGQIIESLPVDVRVRNNTETDNSTDVLSVLNDTIKKHKLYNADSHGENRNSGWVTLDAIPWSKSKISKWQANPTTQGPWPDTQPWDKPNFNKPWNSEFPSKSPTYESNKPWQNKLTKPHWSDNSPTASNKPWYSQERPRPVQQQHDRPSYPAIDKYEDNPNQAEKWPPERPTWDQYTKLPYPSSDIITDNGPSNFPSSNWEKPGERPGYIHHTESNVNEHDGWNDRNDFSNNNKFGRPSNEDGYYDRPHFSHYQYPSTNDHPSNHPSSGDGQWVLLSTNRGYSKTRQRSIKLDGIVDPNTNFKNSAIKKQTENNPNDEKPVSVLTSKRQVRLTVLPSINGTNTTTSHGGLLEVERTFKTVDQSQKEYEIEKKSNSNAIKAGIMINRRPIRNTVGSVPSSSAVLAAVGAGMVPATMAMMIPIMLGKRKKRSILSEEQMPDVVYLRVPKDVFAGVDRKRKFLI